MPSFEPEVLDVGGAGLAHPEAVQAQEDGEGGVGVVEALGGEQERSELGSVEAAGVVGVDLGVLDVLGGVGGDPAVDVGEPVEAADGGQAPVDRGGGEASLLHGSRAIQGIGAVVRRETPNHGGDVIRGGVPLVGCG